MLLKFNRKCKKIIFFSEGGVYNFSYVREWLNLMACGDIIEVDESGEKFWISKDRTEYLCGDKPDALLIFQQNVLMSAKAYSSIIQLFRKDGPLGMLLVYHNVSSIHELISSYNSPPSRTLLP